MHRGGLPQPIAFFLLASPDKRAAAEFRGDFIEGFGLLARRCLGAVEFQEKHRRFRIVEARIGVDRLDRDGVEQFDPGDWNAHLDRGDHGVHRIVDRREWANAGGDALRNANSRNVMLVSTPRVPSEPTNSRVRS